MLESNPSAHPMAGHNQERLSVICLNDAPAPQKKWVMSCPKAINSCLETILIFSKNPSGVPFGNIFRAQRILGVTSVVSLRSTTGTDQKSICVPAGTPESSAPSGRSVFSA